MADDERKPSWIEVSLLVEDELAETVAEVLTRYLSRGVVIERPAAAGSGGDRGRAEVRVTGYLSQDAHFEERKKKIRQALYYLGRIRPLPEPDFREIESENWATAWQARYRPLQLGGRLMIVPTWLENPQPDLVPLYLDPGMAFGSGTHPSTQLALELIVDVLELEKPEAVLDIGCGSGILAIAAVKLGAGRAVGVDVDPESVRVARDNAAVNGVSEQTAFHTGSVPEIRAGQFALRKAPLVAANLIAPLLHQLLEERLTETVAPDGRLVLSGLLEDQAELIIRELEGRQFEVRDRRQQADWVGLLCVKRPGK
jgi:ribosomal protein L11 methyltransferase